MSEDQCAAPPVRRVLRLRDLIVYGIVIITPIAPVPIYGLAETRSEGHAALTVAIAGVAMMLTALSYGQMAALYPSAGSAYTYVGRALHPHLGFLAGWAMLLDYFVLPILAVVQAALAMVRIVPAVPYTVWIVSFAMLMTGLNYRGIRTTVRANMSLVVVMAIVIVAFLIMAVHYLLFFHAASHLGVDASSPPGSLNLHAIATATSLSALTYIGFDGVTTLAEEVDRPRRNVPLATFLVCLLTLVLSFVLVYLAHCVWPDYRTFPQVETAFMDVSRRVGGVALFEALGLVVAISNFGAGLSGQVAAARLLYGMGRENVLPRGLFGFMHPTRKNPTRNVVLIGGIVVIGGLFLNLETSATLLNFGAFLAFMGVNLAAIRERFRSRENNLHHPILKSIVPAMGFLFCLGIWISLPRLAKIAGAFWLLIGFGYDAIRSHGFRKQPVFLDLSQS